MFNIQMPLVMPLPDEATIMQTAIINRRLNGAHVANLVHDGEADLFGINEGDEPGNFTL